MRVVLNGRPRDVAALTVSELIAEVAPSGRVAVELNLQLIPRRLWDQTPLTENDSLEVVQMVGGGAASGCAEYPGTSARCR